MSARQMISSNYQYTPLKPREIRLIQILPPKSPSSPQLQCQCQIQSLDDFSFPSFVAISYTWGDPTPTHEIEINGHPFGIAKNVHDLMQHVRGMPDDRPIWVDAICIDQTNNDEKGQQVPLMGELYSKAASVRAWLGEATSEIAVAMRFVRDLSYVLPSLELGQFRELMERAECFPGSPKWIALADLLDRPWFKRVWVIQEVCLAVDVDMLCGNHSIDWDMLSEVVIQLNKHELLSHVRTSSGKMPWGVVHVVKVSSVRKERQQRREIQMGRMMESFADWEVTNPRDKIYGFLGIVTDAKDPIYKPNYNASTVDIYKDITRHLLQNGQALNQLKQAGIGFDRSLVGLPSWCHDYSARTRSEGLATFRAAGDTLQSMEFSPDGNVLRLQAIIVGTIDRVSAIYGEEGIPGSFDWYCDVFGVMQPSPDQAEELWRTLIADTLRDSGNNVVRPEKSFARSAQAFLTVFSKVHDHPNKDLDFAVTDLEGGLAFRTAMDYAALRRRFCVLKEGRIGLVPGKSMVGDVVCVFYGGGVPFVIRPVTSTAGGDARFELVGGCYIHGIMDGQAMLMDKEKTVVALI